MNITPKSYKIRTKLLLNFGLLFGLSILSLAIYQFTMDWVETGYKQLITEEHSVYNKTLKIRELMLQCRKNEKEFRLSKKSTPSRLVLQDIDAIIQINNHLSTFADNRNLITISNESKNIKESALAYGRDFQKLITAYEKVGLTHDSGLQGDFRKIAHELANVHLSEHALGPMLNAVQRIRHYSRKNNSESRKKTAIEFKHLKKIINNYHARPVYLNQFNDLFGEYNKAVLNYLDAPAGKVESKQGATIDSITTRLVDKLYPVYVPNVQTLLLQIRRYEKDYLLRRGKVDITNHHQAVNRLITTLQENIANKEDSHASIDSINRYQEKFTQLTIQNDQIEKVLAHLQSSAKNVESASESIIIISKNHAENNATLLDQRTARAQKSAITISIAALLIGLCLSLLITNSITKPLQAILNGLKKMAAGDYSVRLKTREDDSSDLAVLARMFNLMAKTITKNEWFADGENLLAEKLRQDHELETICREIITFLTTYLELPLGTIYLRQSDNSLKLVESYAYNGQLTPPENIKIGSGVTGEAARSGKLIVINDLPPDYAAITSSIGHTTPHAILALPISSRNKTVAVIELASLHDFNQAQIEFLNKASEAIAIALNVSRQRTKTIDLLQETQEQAEELQTQQEELKTANEELAEHAQVLRRNEEELKSQQEELQVTNEELEEKAESLEAHNRKLEQAKKDIKLKADALKKASQYKSEFLANMSHELRTPLNSLLLLANNLAKNKANNLNKSQVESAQIIYNSGKDLLQLINDILDLSKIEAGRMDAAEDQIGIRGFGDWLNANFQHMAQDKGLEFKVNIDQSLPKYIVSDRQRLEQITRNLTANAIKFTKEGSVIINFRKSTDGEPTSTLAISVIDTGIGITSKQQDIIFDAFKQADGSTSRKYGGTGLGLSISKKLSEMIGGEIRVMSAAGKGAIFTLFIPLREEKKSKAVPDKVTPPPPKEKQIQVFDDRQNLDSKKKSILIIEDDPNFAKILQELGHSEGFKCLVAPCGSEGLELAEAHAPDAIILDIRLPDISGWEVLESLKNSPALRHIPVHMMSGEVKGVEALKKGAIGFLTKPLSEEDLKNAFNLLEDALSKRVKELLIVEDDQTIVREITHLIAADDLSIQTTNSGQDTISYLQKQRVDCMVLDIGLPDMTGFELLSTLDNLEDVTIPPIIIYTSRDLTREENDALGKYTDTIIIKGLKSEERLLDETALFLHRIIKDMPTKKRQMIANLYDQDSMFANKKILLVDDDMRNAFALSKILEERGMKISIANDGQHALEHLEKNRYDLVLMDIMMPIMDGYETMTRIREQKEFKDLPIIALTAKAMAEDKEKCMAAGASDYLAKPVNEGRLVSMMRVWLYR